MTEQKKFKKKFAKYMPMGDFPNRKGHALQVSTTKDGRDRWRLFVEMAEQVGPKPSSGSTESPFDWKNKKYISCDENEMGLILAVLNGREQEVKIVHKFPHDAPQAQQKMTGLTVTYKGEYKDKKNWGITLFQRMGNEPGETFSIFIGSGEAEVLTLILEHGIKLAYDLN